MKIDRRFTETGHDVYSTVEWVERTSRITHPDGSLVFEMKDAKTPAGWSQLATDIMVSKYFRKAGVPQKDAEGRIRRREDGSVLTGPERSARDVIHRLCGCWKHWGEAHGYFDSSDDADAFYDELAYMLLHQMAAPNSPQWFNTGLNYAYGISGPPQGHYVPDPRTGEIQLADDAYTHPQPHACFIQSVKDDLVNPGGIMDLWVREARLFKYGSGTGTNFSHLRGEGEPLSGGGTSSGLMSWLKIGDRAAAAIKSGGTTRRAAKMVCLDLDHPDIENFVNWKVREELKVAALVEGMKSLPKEQRKIAEELGLKLNYDFNGEAYYTVSGQNSNNSVRIPDEFFDCVDANADWDLYRRTDGQLARSLKARKLWEEVCFAAWKCADPGVQFDSTINAWHTCSESGRINASNPCSEYMFLDNTACNLASINLLKFYDAKTRQFDVEGYEHAIRLWTMVLEISVLMAAYPSAEIARLSYEFRTLGLGYANIGAMLMQAGVPYDSEEGRALCGCLSAILTGRAYAVSAEIAERLGPFKRFDDNRESMLRVMRNHRRAAHGVSREKDSYEELRIKPVPIDQDAVESASERFRSGLDLARRARQAWDDAVDRGERFGYRNAQVSVIAPTGTIGLLMDCDTTGVEPDFALVKFKKLAGGGYFKIANQSLRPALRALGYAEEWIRDIVEYVMGLLRLDVPMPNGEGLFDEFLRAKGFTTEDLAAIEKTLPTVFELGFALNAWSLREDLLKSLDIDPDEARNDPTFNLLRRLGLSNSDIDALNEKICGTQTIEGAPHLKDEHLPVFDCANKCGKKGRRFIRPEGHIRMMAAAQPFISGAISKTINLPAEATVEDIASCYRLSWELGLKANALYRDGCKLSQPLSTKSDVEAIEDEAEDDHDGIEAAHAEVAREVETLAEVVGRTEEESEKVDTRPVRTVEKIVERIVERPLRRRLPDTRHSFTHKFSVAGHEGYLTVGLYEDGSPGELFITMSKEGSTIGGLMDSLGTAISVALQYGVPLESLVGKFSHQRFEPAGMTGNRDIPFAKSLVDYIFRWLGMQFIPGYRQANAPKRGGGDAPSSAPKKESKPEIVTRPTATNGDRAGSSGGESRKVATMAAPATKSAPRVSVGVDDPTPVRESQVKSGPLTRLQSSVMTVAAIADKANAEVSAMLERQASVLDHAMAELMGDAPACDVCGSITVRNGTCYKCLNCGNSMGCS
ncbi:MAG: adenosylcobalamin-dependent ribonucleoside-diphosphate reductase [Phycisphaerales bacterium]